MKPVNSLLDASYSMKERIYTDLIDLQGNKHNVIVNSIEWEGGIDTFIVKCYRQNTMMYICCKLI
jgi:hypothetical protein